MKGIRDRHGRALRLCFRGAGGEAGEFGVQELGAALRVRADLPRLSRRPGFSGGTGLSKSLCDWVVEKLLGFSPIKAELWIRGGNILFNVPSDLGNLLCDLYGIVIRDQYNAAGVRGKVVADAGANIGVFTLYALALGAKKVYAFEAVKETHEMLLANLSLNRCGGKAEAFNIALGARAGRARLRFNTGGAGTSMIDQGAAGVNRGVSYSGIRFVKLMPLDSLLKGRVDFLKLDVEGYEEKVLRGAGRLIKEQKPVLSFSAYHRPADRERLPAAVLALRKDYRIRLHSFAEQDFFCE